MEALTGARGEKHMADKVWEAVDQYFLRKIIGEDTALEEAQKAAEAGGLPAISVTPAQGKLLHLLVRMQGARKVLEVGTLAGYSTIWMARALPPGGKLISLEYEPKHAEIARLNTERAGVSALVEIRVGEAMKTFPDLEGPFDLIFIDADKQNNAGYFQWALKLSRPGSVIIVDNVVREGEVANSGSTDEKVLGVQRMVDLIAAEPRVSATAIQTVGGKSYDGFLVAVVNGLPEVG
jgi:predicted O-methyltransferase YrrM